MKSKTPKTKAITSPKNNLSKHSKLSDKDVSQKISLFDHVKHIRAVQDPDYFKNLSEENRKSFNHFMILRALSMDNDIVQEMAFLYRYLDKIPSPQFYQLLIALVPKHNRWVPWVKTKVVRHSKALLAIVAKHYEVSKWQANRYVNILTNNDEGLEKLVDLLQAMGLNEKEIEKLFDKEQV